ncbi:hypothetical protein BKA69DRAFT_1123519 [Paraphysoderma sedebokerense]|nr:hypothetical protein BKA69DRAFT_1123519 [Paraphysoderma sedebokerense]
MSERLNSIHLSTLNLTTSFGVERRIDKIFENYLLEVHAIVGGTKGYYVERTRHGQMNVRCGFSFHEADDDTRVSIYPVDDPAQQAEIPCAALQYGLERMQLSIIHFDVDRLDEELRIYLGDRVNRLSSALFLPITMGASAKQRILYIETEEPDDSQLDRSIDIQALTFLTQQLVANVDSAKLFSKLVNLNQSLEKKVMERTTELQKRNFELEQAKCEALQAASAKAVFLSNMSHEIRTPISQVILATELLSTLELPSDGLEYLNIIIHSGKLLLSLVNDILDLSKLETGNVILESIEFDLHELIQITMDAFTVESDVKLGYFLEKDVPRVVVGDVTRLRQILTNIVSNAIKFTRSGYVLLFVCSDQVNENEFDVQFNVIDTGSGIAPDNLDKIFNRYVQEDASIARKFGGTGLGLPICQYLCKLMGSRLSVKSVVGSGSTFSFSIRFSRPKSAAERSRFSHIFDDTVKVLILENPTYWYQSRSILCYQIEAMGAEVQSSPLYLYPNIDCSLYDLLIVDLTTTQIEGVRLTDLIRSCDVPVILVHSASQLGVINHIYNDIGSESFRTTTNLDSATTLPALVESQASTEKLKNNVVSLQPESRLVSILLVEDNPINQKIMNTMITKLGYNADIASDGQTAVELAEAKHYDLILMDVCIPVLDGLEATKQIRELYRDREIGSGDEKLAPDPYIVGLSANVSPEHEIEGLHAGMNVYLSKPVSRSMLSEIINNL